MHYAVDLDRLSAHVEHARAFTRRLEEVSARLEVLADELGRSWSGRAADAHREAQARWALGEHELSEGLAAMAAVADRAREEYAAAAAANDRMWGLLA